MLTPLSYPALEFGWTFSSKQCSEGMVGIQDQNLRIFTIEKLTENLQQDSQENTKTPGSTTFLYSGSRHGYPLGIVHPRHRPPYENPLAKN